MAESIKVDVWSDVACPWCYIGKRTLEAAVSEISADGDGPEIVIEYHSYELAPETPVDFVGGEHEFLTGSKGMTADESREMLKHVTEVAGTVGLEYNYDRLQHANTVMAHQLVHYAKAHGKQIDANERLLKAHFSDGRHIGRVEDLADLAEEIGLDRADVVRSLESDEYLSAVRADQELARSYGISAAPFFVFDGRNSISGAQDKDVFVQALEQAVRDRGEVMHD